MGVDLRSGREVLVTSNRVSKGTHSVDLSIRRGASCVDQSCLLVCLQLDCLWRCVAFGRLCRTIVSLRSSSRRVRSGCRWGGALVGATGARGKKILYLRGRAQLGCEPSVGGGRFGRGLPRRPITTHPATAIRHPRAPVTLELICSGCVAFSFSLVATRAVRPLWNLHP